MSVRPTKASAHMANDGSPGQDRPVSIILDTVSVTSPSRRRNGKQIRELGNPDRVEGFETQRLNPQGKKEKTIPDTEEVELHEGEKFRTVPSEGGPGGDA